MHAACHVILLHDYPCNLATEHAPPNRSSQLTRNSGAVTSSEWSSSIGRAVVTSRSFFGFIGSRDFFARFDSSVLMLWGVVFPVSVELRPGVPVNVHTVTRYCTRHTGCKRFTSIDCVHLKFLTFSDGLS